MKTVPSGESSGHREEVQGPLNETAAEAQNQQVAAPSNAPPPSTVRKSVMQAISERFNGTSVAARTTKDDLAQPPSQSWSPCPTYRATAETFPLEESKNEKVAEEFDDEEVESGDDDTDWDDRGLDAGWEQAYGHSTQIKRFNQHFEEHRNTRLTSLFKSQFASGRQLGVSRERGLEIVPCHNIPPNITTKLHLFEPGFLPPFDELVGDCFAFLPLIETYVRGSIFGVQIWLSERDEEREFYTTAIRLSEQSFDTKTETIVTLKREYYARTKFQSCYCDQEKEERIFTQAITHIIDLLQDASSPGTFQPVPFAQFFDMENDEEPIIPNCRYRGQLSTVFGLYKDGKTTLSAIMATQASLGESVLGILPVATPLRVGFISTEDENSKLKRIICATTASYGKDFRDSQNLFVHDKPVQILSESGRQDIRRFVRQNKIDWLIIDSAYRHMEDLVNTAVLNAVAKEINPIAQIASEYNLSIDLGLHTVKHLTNPYTVRHIGELAGAGFSESMRAWTGVSRRQPFVLLGPKHQKFWVVIGGSLGFQTIVGVDVYDHHDKYDWRVDVRSQDETKEHDNQGKVENQAIRKQSKQMDRLELDTKLVLDFIERHPQGISKTQIKDHSKVSTDKRVYAAIDALLKCKSIEACQYKVKCGKAGATKSQEGFRMTASNTRVNPVQDGQDPGRPG